MFLRFTIVTVLLAASSSAFAEPFSISDNGKEVTDEATGLVWRHCPEGMTASKKACTGNAATFDHDGAVKRANAQAKSTGIAWRLPNTDELLSIADEKRFGLAIDTTVFPGTPPEHFWTSVRRNQEYADAVHFYNGFHYDRYHTNQNHVRLVRDGK